MQLIMALALGLAAGSAQASAPPGAPPWRCSAVQACSSGACLFLPGSLSVRVELSAEPEHYVVGGRPAAGFGTLDDAQTAVAKGMLGPDVTQVLVADPEIADAIGFWLYGVATRDGTTRLSETGVRLACVSDIGQGTTW